MSLLIKKGKNKTEYTIENLYLYKTFSESLVIENSHKLKIRSKIYYGKANAEIMNEFSCFSI